MISAKFLQFWKTNMLRFDTHTVFCFFLSRYSMYCNKRTLLIISLTRDEANCGHRSQGNSEYIFKDLYLITNSRNTAKRKRLMCKYNFILGTIWLLLVCYDTSLTLAHLAKDFWLKMLDFFFVDRNLVMEIHLETCTLHRS